MGRAYPLFPQEGETPPGTLTYVRSLWWIYCTLKLRWLPEFALIPDIVVIPPSSWRPPPDDHIDGIVETAKKFAR